MGWIIYTLLGIGIIVLLLLIIFLTRKKSSEGFVTYVAPDINTYLSRLQTTVGRYVILNPNVSAGDKYLSISQIQILDMNGNNLALGKTAYTDKDPTKMTGSADISVTVDGTLLARAGLSKTWQSGSPGASWSIDLGNSYQISEVVYTGRADSDNIALSRIKGMVAKVFDANKNVVASKDFLTVDINQRVTFPNFMNITPSPVNGIIYPISPLVLTFNGKANLPTQSFPFIDVQRLYDYIGALNRSSTTPAAWGKSYMDLSGGGLYGTLMQTSPINYLYEIGDSNIPTCDIQYVGSMSDEAKKDMEDSLSLCRRIFLGSIEDIDRFINIKYDNLKPYIRANTGFANFCRAELVQTLSGTDYKTSYSETNATKNMEDNRCFTEFTSDMLGLLPFVTRQFIKRWIFNRTQRIIQTKFVDTESECRTLSTKVTASGKVCGAAMKEASDSLILMNPTVKGQRIGLDISNKAILDSIAQAFYEAMNGKYVMSNITDISTIGGTILDIRFDLQAQADTSTIQDKISALKTKYQSIQNSAKVSQDILDQAQYSYDVGLANLESDLMSAVLPPVVGVVGRFFYTYNTSTGEFVITGFSLDSRCVTSFISEFNCGAELNTAVSSGNVGYAPSIKYTNNPSVNFSCTDPASIKRIMMDYVEAVQAGDIVTDLDTKTYTLRVSKVTGAQSAPNNPLTCQIAWDEIAWDDSKNLPQPKVSRKATLPYSLDQSVWGSSDPVMDASGFVFITDNIASVGPYVYEKAIPGGDYLDTASDACPTKTTCEDISVLFNLADQYNADPTAPGSIIRITKAYTPNKYQCDIEADINYDSTVQDKNGATVKKGSFKFDKTGNQVPNTATIPSGVTTADKLSLSVHMDMTTCSITYDTAKSAAAGGGTFIQANTPPLYKPMEYSTELKNKVKTPLENALNTIKDAVSGVATLASDVLPPFRKNTLDAAGAIGFLGACPAVSCKSTSVLNAMMTYFKSKNLHQKQIAKVIKVGTMSSDSCDITYDEETLEPNGAGQTGFKVGVKTTKGMRFIMQPTQTDECMFNAVAMIPILPEPPNSDLIDPHTISTGNKANEVFVITKNNCAYYNAKSADSQQRIQIQNMGMTAGLDFCYGVKPGPNTDGVSPFSSSSWNIPYSFDSVKMPSTATDNPFSYENPQKEAFENYGPPIQVSESTFPLSTSSFGNDRTRNNEGNIETYYEEPLYQTETTVKTRGSKGNSYRYIRFRPYKTRNPENPTVNVAKFRFFLGKNEVDLRNAKVTNPMGTWVGRIEDVTTNGHEKGWSDAHKKAIIFAFPYPVLMDGFSWTTANPDAGVDGDPVRWKLEGSSNGIYWTTLRDQSSVSYPVSKTRFEELPIFRF